MLVGIDGNEANISRRVGVNMYAFDLLRSIYQIQEEWEGRHQFVIYLKSRPLADMPKETAGWRYKIIPGGSQWIIKKLMPALYKKEGRVDVFFTPSHYVPPLAPMPRVMAIMDLGYLEFSGQFTKKDFWQLTLWSAWSIIVSKYIITISESSKRDIVRHYPFSAGKVGVTLLGYDKERFKTGVKPEEIRRVAKKYGISGEYVLFLGTLKPSKNVEGLVEAWAQVADRFPQTALVVGGKKGWLYEAIFRKVRDNSLTSRVIFTDYVGEKDKPGLMAGARAFVIPSFWEGFGLDALSAMACGVVVIASNRGSLPEVVGDAGILVEPEKPEEIAGAITKVLDMDKTQYNNLVKRGLTQAEKFSWEKTARESLKIIENAVR